MELNDKIEINASAEKIWAVLTDNKYVKQYMFTCEIDSEWKVGSDLIYHRLHEGKRMDAVLGKIVELNAPNLLHHTLFPAGASYPNIPENHIFVIYSIIENENSSILIVKQGGYDTVAEGEKRFASSQGGWDMILPHVKRLSEEES